MCKVCRKEQRDKWRTENKERVAEKDTLWKQKNPEKVKEIYKKFYTLHPKYQKVYKLPPNKRKPKWANTEQIRQFYVNCPEGFHVDHIIPLRGKLVCGLHVIENLQYLPAIENIKKGNRYAVYA